MILCRIAAQGATETAAHPKRQLSLAPQIGSSTPAILIADQKSKGEYALALDLPGVSLPQRYKMILRNPEPFWPGVKPCSYRGSY
jgi:hypothetical protein